MNYGSALFPPYPALLSQWAGANHAREFDKTLFTWLNGVFQIDVSGFSVDELEIVLASRRGYRGNVANTISHVDAIRRAITSLSLGGFGSVLREFEQLMAAPGLTPDDRMRQLYQTIGGIPAVCPGGAFLAIPCPSGEWAVTNGVQLQRQWKTPFGSDAYPLS